jgi:hypothetical protein
MRRRHSHFRSRAEQLDLFVAPNRDAVDEASPGWWTLPEQTRQTVMSLLARLISEHASDHRRTPEDARHDA